MRKKKGDIVLPVVVLTAILVCAAPDVSIAGTGTTAGPSPVPTLVTPYELLPGSNFYRGCFGPCLCPVVIVGELTGTFDLTPLAPTSLFTRYSVTNVSWTVIDSQGRVIHQIAGNGIYEISREVPLMQQMTLFLSIDGKQAVTFDSGLVPETVRFPDISIRIGNGTCYGFWMTINAIPKY